MLKNSLKLIDGSKYKLGLYLILIVVVAIFELLSLSVMLPLLSNFMDGISINIGLWPIDIVLEWLSDLDLFVFGALIIIIFLLKNLVYIGAQYFIHRVSADLQHLLRVRLMKQMLTSSFSIVSDSKSSEYSYAITVLVGLFANSVVFQSLKAFGDMLMTISLLMLFGAANFKLLMVVMFSLGTIAGLIYFSTFHRLQTYGQKINKAQINMISNVEDTFNGLKQIFVNGYHSIVQNNISSSSHQFSQYQTYSNFITALTRPMLEFLFILVLFLCFYLGYFGFLDIEKSDVLIMMMVSIRILPLIISLNTAAQKIRFNKNTVNVLSKLLFAKSSNTSRLSIKATSNEDKLHPVIDIKNLQILGAGAKSINKPLNTRMTLPNLYVLKGESGTGKTSILDAICGLQSNYRGEVTTTNLNESQEIYYGTQNAYFFNGTVLENILMGSLELSDTDESMINRLLLQLKLIESEDEAANFLKRKVLKNNFGMSGGQFQRIALIRAIMSKKKVFLLDEPTSALDERSEKIFFQTLYEYAQNRLIIIVSHSDFQFSKGSVETCINKN